MKKKKAFIISIDGNIIPKIYMALNMLCYEHDINYSSASKGKRIFVREQSIKIITEAEFVKIKGRGKQQ